MVDDTIYQTPKELHDASVGAIKFIGQFVAGFVVVVGLWMGWKRLSLLEESNRLVGDGQVTDRFVKAVELLGKETTEEKLGGIFSLERIAKDSPNDHWTIMEILTAYVREKAPYLVADDEPFIPAENKIIIQSIIDVFSRRCDGYDKGDFDLTRTDLSKILFNKNRGHRVNLTNFHFTGSFLTHAYFNNCDIDASHLNVCNMRYACFESSTVRSRIKVSFIGSDMFPTVFVDTKFIDVDMTSVENVDTCKFSGCTFEGDTNIPNVYPVPKVGTV